MSETTAIEITNDLIQSICTGPLESDDPDAFARLQLQSAYWDVCAAWDRMGKIVRRAKENAESALSLMERGFMPSESEFDSANRDLPIAKTELKAAADRVKALLHLLALRGLIEQADYRFTVNSYTR